MTFSAPIGESDFRQIRKQNATYVDKTSAIIELVSSPTKVFLFTRPRRFGKSTFISTLHAFFQLPELLGEDTAPLFADLTVWRSEAARAHHQRYPVLSLSFKGVQQQSWEMAREAMRNHISLVVQSLGATLQHPSIPAAQLQRVSAMLVPGAGEGILQDAIVILCGALHAATGRPVFLLIDEYDSPLHAAWTHGYLDEALSFFRTLLGGGLKENPFLHKAVITGILRVARESLFSGVNHLEVFSMLSGSGFGDTFGFTQLEVEQLAASAGLSDRMPEIDAWYNGYLVDGVKLYNPWSVLNYLKRPIPRAHWVNTGGTTLIEALLDRLGPRLWPDVESLLAGGTIRGTIDENLIFDDLSRSRDALWSLLLAAGYLKATRTEYLRGRLVADLVLPNEELKTSWQHMTSRHLELALSGGEAVDHLTRAMLAGDERAFAADLQALAANALSFYDTAGDWPERVWQAFVLGILVHLSPDWEVRSNQELGYGRADVTVRPRVAGRPGAVIEFKKVEEGKTVRGALRAAMAQLKRRDYAAGLRGIAEPIHQIAIVFEGKRAHVKMAR
jgi:hypothetical protein